MSDNRSPMLVVAPTWVGDFVRNQSLTKYLRQQFPARPIDLLTNPVAQPIGRFMPEIRKTWALDVPKGRLGLKRRWQLGRRLAREAYGTAVIVNGSIKVALVPLFAGIRQRIGWLGECRYFLLTEPHRGENKLQRTVDRLAMLGLAEGERPPVEWPHPALVVSPDQVQCWRRRIGLQRTDRPVIAIAPGSMAPARRWPVKYYAELARRCRARGWDVWILGAPSEKPMANLIRSHAGSECVDFTGTDLHDAVMQLSCATIVVANDSGLLHVAAALNKPTVAIYGSSPRELTGPLNPVVEYVSLKMDCQFCYDHKCPLGHHQCMTALSPEMVFEPVERAVRVSQHLRSTSPALELG